MAAVACEELGRRYVVIERDPDYAQVGRDRVAAVAPPDGAAAVQLGLFDGVE